MQNAIDKLKSEIEKESENPHVKLIGEHLIEYIQANPHIADVIANTEKTIVDSLRVVNEEADKRLPKNSSLIRSVSTRPIMIMMAGEEVLNIVANYFEIPVPFADISPKKVTAQKPLLDTSLDAYL